MITENETKLLVELSRLINKYGEKTFCTLIKNLKDPKFLSSIVTLSKVAPTLKKTRKKSGGKTDYNKKSKEKIEKFSSSDIEKYKLLKEILLGIDSKKYFKTLKDFTYFLNDRSVFDKQIRSRSQGKYLFLSHIINKNESQIKEILNQLENTKDINDRSLDAWSEVILNKTKKN